MSSHKTRTSLVNEQNEERITEITVAPDGRVYVFGASAAVLEALSAIGLGGEALQRRLSCLKKVADEATNGAT